MAEKSSYRSIFKGTAIYGGVQVFNIVVNLVRGKLVAVLLGPGGMGISSMLSVSVNTIQQFSSLGLNLAAVKEISEAKETGDAVRLSEAICVTKRLLMFTATVGAIACVALAPWLSQWAFGNGEYTWHFVALAALVALSTISNGNALVLQGLREAKRLAYSSVVGSSVGLCVGIPLYYFLGYDGIVPAMIALSLASYLFYKIQLRKAYNGDACNGSLMQMAPLMRKMLSLGFFMLMSALLGTVANYTLNLFIRHNGSLDDVGLWQAASSLTNQYIGFVFAAMAMDYMPRLAAVSADNEKMMGVVNNQMEMVLLMAAPMAALLIVTAPLVVRVLLSDTFAPVIPALRWMGVGMFLQAAVFPMGYITFAKGDKTAFLLLEGVWGNILMCGLRCASFYFWGVIGVGVSIVMGYIIMLFVYRAVTGRLYGFEFGEASLKLFLLLGGGMTLVFMATFISDALYAYTLASAICAVLCFFSLKELDRRIGLKDLVNKKLGFRL